MKNNLMTKADAKRQINDCLFTCQRLYNISERGLWADVAAAGQEVLNKISETAQFTKEQMTEILKPAFGDMYAIAGYDD